MTTATITHDGTTLDDACRWCDALTRMEGDLTRVETLLGSLETGAAVDEPPALDPWSEPVGLGPVPEPLLPRAREVLDRQRRLTVMLTQASARNRAHRNVANAARDTGAAGAVYVDTAM